MTPEPVAVNLPTLQRVYELAELTSCRSVPEQMALMHVAELLDGRDDGHRVIDCLLTYEPGDWDDEFGVEDVAPNPAYL